tara:strand:+ start:490 stop:861 length:372 start_codon:yes stop_codon:yes gene_type:complete
VSGLNKSEGDTTYLKTLGWLPFVEVSVTLGSDEVIDGEVVEITADGVTATQAKRAMTASEIADTLASKWEAIREQRNTRISESDWMASSDVIMTDAWAAYRQALRDIPSQSDVDNITWPTEPD